MQFEIREFIASDYAAALSLWKRCEGIGLSAADEKCPVVSFLEHNPGLSFVASDKNEVIGTVLCGSDSRRGYLYHLAVDPLYRHQGVGGQLAERSLEGLQAAGIQKCHIMVFENNQSGQTFWQNSGWIPRPEIVLMSYDVTVRKESSPC
jgi:N-acetylglutamate synthase